MKTLPTHVAAYKRTPRFTQDTIPAGLLRDHRTKENVWALIHVESGKLQYTICDAEVHLLTPDHPGVVEPGVAHHVTPLGKVAFFVEFYSGAQDRPEDPHA